MRRNGGYNFLKQFTNRIFFFVILFFSTTSSPYNLSIIHFSLKLSLDLKRIWVDLFFYMAKKCFLSLLLNKIEGEHRIPKPNLTSSKLCYT